MGSLTFCQEYIDYLKACNTNLRDELEKVRNIEKNRVVSKELRNAEVDMTTNEITNICNSACEAIDDLFHNFTTTMNSLKNVLLWKSQISMIPKKYSMALIGDQNELNELSPTMNNESDVPSLIDIPENRNGKKLGGTAKVSPMINGHIISTPTIHLNRVSEEFEPPNRMGPLSPILEMSPESSQVNSGPVFRDLRIPLRRLHINTFSRRTSEGSRETRKGPKFAFIRKRPASFDLKKHCSSFNENRNCPEANEREVATDRENREAEERSMQVENSMVEENEESPSNRFEAKENHEPGRSNSDDVDPLEGPSWLLDRPRKSGKTRSSSPNDSPFRYGFVNFKRRGAISSANLQCQSGVEGNKVQKKEVLSFSENGELDDFQRNEKMECGSPVPHKIQTRRERSLSSSDLEEEIEDNGELDDQYCELKNDSISKQSLDFRSSARRSSLRGMYVRKSNDSMALTCSQKLSNKIGSTSFNNSKIENKALVTPIQGKNCSVNLVRLSSTVTDASENCTPSKLRKESIETAIVSPNPCRRSVKRISTAVRKTPIQINERVKRRAAEVCTQNRKWIEITPKGEKSSKGRSGKKKTSYKKKV